MSSLLFNNSQVSIKLWTGPAHFKYKYPINRSTLIKWIWYHTWAQYTNKLDDIKDITN
ncbi:hypothetical protein Hanom_Chr11g01051901 [Helianthus anomalus]